jgi:catechol 2,3-dioxygenase-like lactoylglutathione lyase family enzyme
MQEKVLDKRAGPPIDAVRKGVPAFMAHFVIRTSRFSEVLAWYKHFFQAEVVYQGQLGAFLAYDDEHHRIAIANIAGLKEQTDETAGIDHVAFSLECLEDLMHTFERLKGVGIKPVWCINHGPTTSMYFKDPDGTRVELQVDNFPTKDQTKAVFGSESFARNPVGVEFDPELLLKKHRFGVPAGELLKQGSAAGVQ